MSRGAPSPLIGRVECARLLGMHPKNWDAYWRRHDDLIKGVRVVSVTGRGRGTRRWPEHVIARHIETVCR